MSGKGCLTVQLFGFMTIYAVLGVEFFGKMSDHSECLFVALWTLFIMTNAESWPDFAEPSNFIGMLNYISHLPLLQRRRLC